MASAVKIHDHFSIEIDSKSDNYFELQKHFPNSSLQMPALVSGGW